MRLCLTLVGSLFRRSRRTQKRRRAFVPLSACRERQIWIADRYRVVRGRFEMFSMQSIAMRYVEKESDGH